MPEMVDSRTGKVIKGALVTVLVNKLDDRLRAAYACAQRSTHEGGRVEIHVGSDVYAYLEARMPAPDPLAFRSGMIGRTCWGFPIAEAAGSNLRPEVEKAIRSHFARLESSLTLSV